MNIHYIKVLIISWLMFFSVTVFAQFGISTLIAANQLSGNEKELFKIKPTVFGSSSALFMAGYTKHLNKGKVQFFFEPQFGFHAKKFSFKNNLAISKVAEHFIFTPDTNSLHNYNPENSYGKSKLTANYFRTVPLFGVEFSFGEKHSAYLAAGPVVEILLSVRHTNRYMEAEKKVQNKLYGSENEMFNLQSYQFGYCATLGFDRCGVWFATSLNSFFNQAQYNSMRAGEIGFFFPPKF